MTGDRIPCVNPACRRTAPADRYEPGIEIVCRKCWKLLPSRLTSTYKQLAKRRRRMERHARKPDRREVAERLITAIEGLQDRNWREIRDHFLKPEKPVGLDAHLEELGLS